MAATILVVQGAGDMHDPEGTIVLVRFLDRELGGEGAAIVAPEMPKADEDPRYEPWRDAIRDALGRIEGPVQLVGHSFGATVLLKMLADHPIDSQLCSLHLVATPWWGTEGWSWDEVALPEGFARHLPHVPIFLYHSVGDPHVPFAHLAFYESRIPRASIRRIPGEEHSFRDGLPELIEDLRATAPD